METSGMLKLAKLFFATAVTAFGLALFAGPASAEDTVWICKPGQVDDLCAGSISTTAGGEPIGFTRPEDPPVDCFYVYPTVSEQATPNADLTKDPEVRRVVVQQARMFSRVCDVYAPMYRQETNPGVYSESTEVAYQSALSSWKDYLANHNDGRGVILVGHSQGSATLGRLIDEEIDPVPAVRKKLVGAILPGANIHVPKNELVGGMYENVPACSEVGESGCLVAYSMFNGTPPDNPPFADVGSGYWAYKIPRPDRESNEAVCVNPAEMSGQSFLTPLVNLDYLLAPPPGDVETEFWSGYPDALTASCDREGTKHWLNVDYNGVPDPFLPLLVSVVASGINWHVPEVNVAEENLVQIAGLQSASYVASERAALAKKRSAVRRQLKSAKKKSKKLSKQARKAKKLCASKGKRCAKAKKLGKKSKKAQRRVSSLKKRERALTREIRSLVIPTT